MLNWGKNRAVNAYAPIGNGSVEGCQGLLMRAENNWHHQFLLENSVTLYRLWCSDVLKVPLTCSEVPFCSILYPGFYLWLWLFFVCLCTRLLVYLPGKQTKTLSFLGWFLKQQSAQQSFSPGSGERVQRKLLLPPTFFCMLNFTFLLEEEHLSVLRKVLFISSLFSWKVWRHFLHSSLLNPSYQNPVPHWLPVTLSSQMGPGSCPLFWYHQ